MNIIETFMTQYKEMSQHFEVIRSYTQDILKSSLKDAGIMAITTSRVKDPERLEEKLNERDQEKHYGSSDEIISDIPDFIGMRIALYFPGDNDRVRTLIYQLFEVEKEKHFPAEQRKNDIYERKFPGYCATHYRVYLKKLPPSIQDNSRIEIQVASLLMHAWSEVEHDLTYKQKKGDVSYDEYESLDEINGLVLAGELSLRRLQRVSELRIEAEKKGFENHYQLASFIWEKASASMSGDVPYLGDVETLFLLFKNQNRLTTRKIENDLSRVDWNSDCPIAQQLIDLYADYNVDATNLVINSKRKKAVPEPDNISDINDSQIGTFLRKWVALEKKIVSLLRKKDFNVKQVGIGYQLIVKSGVLPDNILGEYKVLKYVRNKLVHELEIPDAMDIEEYIKSMDTILSFL